MSKQWMRYRRNSYGQKLKEEVDKRKKEKKADPVMSRLRMAKRLQGGFGGGG